MRDEIEYQFARQKRENELQAQYNAQSIAENWDDFWTNLAVNGAANMVGLTFDAIPILRILGSNIGKNLLKGGKSLLSKV